MPNLFRIDVVFTDLRAIIRFLPVTVELALASMAGGLIFGLILALIRIKKIPVITQLAGIFISFIRGTPIIVQLYITYFGIPILIEYINYYQGTDIQGNGLPPVLYAIAALAFNQAAYNSVTIQSAFESVNRGEVEAAESLGMTGGQRTRRIIIPEAIEVAIPSLGNNLITLIKGTSLAFTCAVIEMTAESKILAGRNYRYFESYIALALIYWGLTIILEQVIALIVKAYRVPASPKPITAEQQKLLAEQSLIIPNGTAELAKDTIDQRQNDLSASIKENMARVGKKTVKQSANI